MTKFINSIDVLGDDAVIDSILLRTITEFKDDVITKIATYVFDHCENMTIVDVPSVARIEKAAFNFCSSLNALILRNQNMVTLENINAFNASIIASGTGFIYVPAALKDQYASATNWSTYATQIRALEDYTVDGTITGELDETKI